MRLRSIPVLFALSLGASASAQSPSEMPQLTWATFVGGTGRAPVRTVIGDSAGVIELGDSPWRCGYGRPRSATISANDWSLQRVLSCRRDGATVSATASCRIRSDRVEEHAAALTLGSIGESANITVSLSCSRP